MFNTKDIITYKRDKFRISIRQQQNEKIFSQKRYAVLFPQNQYETCIYEEKSNVQSLNLKVLETIQTYNQNQYNLSNELQQFFDEKCAQNFNEAYSLGLHINLYNLIKNFPLNAQFQVNALKVLANIIYYVDIPFFRDDPNIIDLLINLTCQNDFSLVSQAAICVLGNLLSEQDANYFKHYVLKNQLFFQFWNDYFEAEQNFGTIRIRACRLPWILVSLVSDLEMENEEYLGPLQLIKLIITNIKFQNMDAETAKDTIQTLKQILKRCSPSFIDEIINEVMYKEIVQLVEVSQGKFEQFDLKINSKAAKVLLIICENLEGESRINFFYYGLKETIIYLFSSNQDHCVFIALSFLGLFFQTNSKFVDEIFYDFYEDSQLTSKLIQLASLSIQTIIQSEALRGIDFAISYGSAFINQKFIEDGLFYYLIPLLKSQKIEICQQILQIIDTIYQREEYTMEDKLKWLNTRLDNQNFMKELEYIMDFTNDEETLMLCHRILNNMDQ